MKRIIVILILFFILITPVKALPLPIDVTADSVVLYNLDKDQIIYSKNPDKQQILASLTKIMTAYTVIENVEDLNKKVKITEKDIADLYGFTCIGLEVGDKVSYLDLLYGTLLESGADASQTLAIHTAGSIEEFNKMMNEEAKKLGLRNTNFEDSYGGHDDNISTAREMAILLKEALKNETFKKVFSSNQKTISNGRIVYNYTRNFAVFHGLDETLLTGNKSGYTPEAGLLLASTATINNTNYALIVMKSDINTYMSQHVLDSYEVYDYVKTLTFQTITIIPKDTILKRIPVENGTINEYIVTTEKDINITLTPEEHQNVVVEYHIADKITPNNKKGDNLGYVDILVGNEVIATYDVYLKDEIYLYQEQKKTSIIVIITLLVIIFILLCTNIFNMKKKKF